MHTIWFSKMNGFAVKPVAPRKVDIVFMLLNGTERVGGESRVRI